MVSLNHVRVSDTADGLMLSLLEEKEECREIRNPISPAEATAINSALAKKPILSAVIRQAIETNQEIGRTLKKIEIQRHRRTNNFYALLTWALNDQENTEQTGIVQAAIMSLHFGIPLRITEALLEKYKVPEEQKILEIMLAMSQMEPEQIRTVLIENLPKMPKGLLGELMGGFIGKEDYEGAALVRDELKSGPSSPDDQSSTS